MPFVHSVQVRGDAVSRVLSGERPVDVAHVLGLSPTTVYTWLHAEAPGAVRSSAPCTRCGDTPTRPADPAAYAHPLGLYLGDGCISSRGRSWFLRVACDDRYPRLLEEAATVVGAVSGGRVQRVACVGCHNVQSQWRHWPCVLPQHGPGKKHLRPVVLEAWQREVVHAHPGSLVRGLFNSDGWRGENVAVRRVGATVVRYRYPRYEFTNLSDDIRRICTEALDLLGIAWRPNGRIRISVARRDAVAALDEHVGPKS